MGLAVSFYYDKQFEYALELIKKYVSINPSDSDGHNVLGILLKTLKRYDDAEAAYRKAIKSNPFMGDRSNFLGSATSSGASLVVTAAAQSAKRVLHSQGWGAWTCARIHGLA